MAEYEAYKDSGAEWLGKVPAHWEIIRLQTQLDEVNEKNDPVKTTQILSLTNKLGVVPYEDKGNQGNKSKEDLSDYKIAYPNCIVANSMNILIGSVGLSQYYGCVSPVYYVFQAKTGANIEYLNYLFSMPSFQRELRKYANGILEIRLRVSSGNILKRKVAIPPADEQKAIVDYLNSETERIDAIIAEAKASIEEYKAWKASVIYETVTKGLNSDVEMKDSGIDYIGEIPSAWVTKRLRHIGNTQNGISKGAEFFGAGYPFVSYGDVYKNYSLPDIPSGLVLSTDDERSHYSVEEGDIFFTRTSETIDEIGFSCVCEKTIPNATFAGFLIRVRPHTDDLLTGFAKYYFRSMHHRAFFVKEMNLVTRASLSQGLLKSMPVLVPPKDEQQRIAEYLDEKCSVVDALIQEKQGLIADLEIYKKSLIFEVVTGKRRVME